MREIKTDAYQLGANLSEAWVEQSHNIIYDENEYVYGALVAVIARGAILASGSPGGGKTLYAVNLHRLFDDVSREESVNIPIDPYLTAKELVGGTISSTRYLQLEQDGRTTDSKEKRETVVDPMITPKTKLIVGDEATRMPPEIRGALLSIPEERVLRTTAGIVELLVFQGMFDTMNPAEMQDATVPMGSADVSRHMVGAIVGNDRTIESEIKLQDGILPDLNSVKPVVSIRQLDIIRETVDIMRLPRNNAESRVMRVKRAEQLLNKNYPRISEKGRMHQQVGRMARILAILDGTGIVSEEAFNQAIRFAMASRIGAMERNIDEAPSILDDLHTQVMAAA